MDIERKLGLWLLEQHPEDGARVLAGRKDDEAASLLLEVTAAAAARVLWSLGTTRAAAIVAELADDRLAEILGALPRPVAVDLLRKASDNLRHRFLTGLGERERGPWAAALSFGERTAGALMDADVLTVHAAHSVQDAVRLVEQDRARARNYVYVVDGDMRLQGVVGMRELFVASRKQPIVAIMRTTVESILPEAGYHAVIGHPGWREVHSLPVVDRDGVLLGAIRYRTLRRLEAEMEGEPDESTTVAALGELFWTGVAGLAGALGTGLESGRKGR